MVQILPPVERKQSFSQKLGAGVGDAINLQMQREAIRAQDEAKQRMLSQEYGLRGDLLEKEYGLKGNLEKGKREASKVEDTKTQDLIKSIAGDEIADLWAGSTEGGRTSIIQSILEAGKRGVNTRDLLNLKPQEGSEQSAKKYIDFDKGLTPSERTKREENRYNKNLPLQQELQMRSQAHEMESEELGILGELSPQIGGIERLNINPMTGDLLIPGLASAEAQRFVKTVNDFTRLAKDSYGSRVTNFDLNQFMRRLPTLANSQEGRSQIIRQMQIINEINQAHERALIDTLDEHGGIRKIDYDRAQDFADKKAKPEVQRLKGELKKIGVDQDRQYQKEVDDIKKVTPKGRVAVQFADGRKAHIPEDKVKDFLKTEGNRVL